MVPLPIDPKAADREFWARFHELRRVRHIESRPDDPLVPDGVVEAAMTRDNPFEHHLYYEISRNGVMLGYLHLEAVTPSNPEFETNRHILWAQAYVRPERRRQGIGSLWLPVLLREAERFGSTVVEMVAEQDAGHGFLRWAGAEPKMTEIESRLKLSEVDWQALERWVAEGAARSPQTRLEIYDGPMPDASLAEYAPQLTAMLNSMPWEGLDHGDIVVTPERIRDFNERLAMVGEVPHTVLTREPDGVVSGITDVTWAPFRRSLLYQQFTGVRPDARGRGLGKWIKAAMVLHLRDLHPDLEWIVTENAHSNGPMLNINRAMGFKPYRTSIDYQLTKAALEARVSSL